MYLGFKKRVKRIFYLLLMILPWLSGCGGETIENLQLDRYEAEIVDFERENQYEGSPKGAIVFIGDTHIKNWKNIYSDFQGMPVKNRGFGNATLREVNHYFRRLTDPFQPEVLVLHAGASDIAMGASPQEAFEAFQGFLQQIAISRRASRTIFLSLVPTEAQWDLWPEFQQTNQMIRELAQDNPMLEFLDLTREMVDADGQPIHQLYEKDGQNINSTGYARWSGALLPVLEKMF